jgi:hypothetical protein
VDHFEGLVPKGGYYCYNEQVAYPLVPSDMYVALQGVRSNLLSDTAYASANYSPVGFFFLPAPVTLLITVLSKKLNPMS